jgi:hypothetical protein
MAVPTAPTPTPTLQRGDTERRLGLDQRVTIPPFSSRSTPRRDPSPATLAILTREVLGLGTAVEATE